MEVTSEPRVYMRHVRQAKLCSRGSRVWCEAHGVDWNDFLLNGVPSATLEAIGDPIIMRVVNAAKSEAESNG